MKFLSFLLSLLIHAFFVLVFLLIIKTPTVKPRKTTIYTVNLIELSKKKAKPKILQKPKPKPKIIPKPKPRPKPTMKPKLKPKPKPIVKPRSRPKPKPKPVIKPKRKPKPKQKISRQKPKKILRPKYKPKYRKKVPKPNIEEKIRLIREKVMLQQIKERLLEEKIKALKEHILTQREAQERFSQKLASSYVSLIKSIIYKNWGVEKSIIKNNVFIAKVEIKLDYRGNLINLYMIKSSGNAYFDGTVIDAIKSSEPFPPPPKEILNGGVVDFIIIFDSREKR